MKEIIVSDHSKLPRIVGDQITIDEAKNRFTSSYDRSMILTIVNNTWYQIIVPDGEYLAVYEQYHRGDNFHRTWCDLTLEEFIPAIIGMYLNTEFYLIEGIQDIFEIIKERIPRWLPTEVFQ